MKKEFIQFRYYDYQGIQNHLSEMASRGWQLQSIGNYFWNYKKCPPEQLKYCVQYKDRDLSSLAAYAGDAEVEAEAIAAAADRGWTHVDTWSNFRIYSTRDLNAEPLETDDAQRFEKIRKVTSKTFIIPMVLLLFVSVLLFFTSARPLYLRPLENLSSYTSILVGVSAIFVGIITIATILQCLSWLVKSGRSIEKGGSCADPHTRLYRALDCSVYGFLAVFVVVFIGSISQELGAADGLFAALYFAVIFLLLAGLSKFNSGLKKRKAAKKKIIIFDILLVAVLVVVFTFLPSIMPDSSDQKKAELPVSLQDFGKISGSDRYFYDNETFILSRMEGYDSSDDDDAWISYSVNKIKNPEQYDWFLEKAFYENSIFVAPGFSLKDNWKKISDSGWGTDIAYREIVYADEDIPEEDIPYPDWILGTGEYIIYISMSWEPTDSQKKKIIDQLLAAAK